MAKNNVSRYPQYRTPVPMLRAAHRFYRGAAYRPCCGTALVQSVFPTLVTLAFMPFR